MFTNRYILTFLSVFCNTFWRILFQVNAITLVIRPQPVRLILCGHHFVLHVRMLDAHIYDNNCRHDYRQNGQKQRNEAGLIVCEFFHIAIAYISLLLIDYIRESIVSTSFTFAFYERASRTTFGTITAVPAGTAVCPHTIPYSRYGRGFSGCHGRRTRVHAHHPCFARTY